MDADFALYKDIAIDFSGAKKQAQLPPPPPLSPPQCLVAVPRALCLETTRSLARWLCEKLCALPLAAQLVALKCVARICVHCRDVSDGDENARDAASTPTPPTTISIGEALGDHLRMLVALGN